MDIFSGWTEARQMPVREDDPGAARRAGSHNVRAAPGGAPAPRAEALASAPGTGRGTAAEQSCCCG